MDDVAQKLAVLERQVEALWLMLDKMADVLFTTTVRGDAMQQLLTEHGLLGPAAVTARMAQMQDSAAHGDGVGPIAAGQGMASAAAGR